jgi:hypothetical protein
MTTKTVYLFDQITGALTGTYNAEQSPLEPEIRDDSGKVIRAAVYIMPEFSTAKIPPAAGKNQIPVFSRELDAWALSPDFRGAVVYDAATGAEVKIGSIGPLPSGVIESLTLDLQIAIAAREAEARLYDACQKSIISGFLSGALGAQYAYPSGIVDQLNMNAIATESNSPALPAGWVRKLWCTDAAGAWSSLDHNATQVQQVLSDFASHRESNSATLAAKLVKVRAAKTLAAIAKVTW